jgi:orotate phosphoribosyltransferase
LNHIIDYLQGQAGQEAMVEKIKIYRATYGVELA